MANRGTLFLDEIAELLNDSHVRLVTILGPGGMGKTRLSLEAAEQQLGNFPDGVYFIPMASLNAADDIVPAIAEQIFYHFQQA